MKVYDFDGTIYHGDSSVDFFLFCLRRDPSLVRFLPTMLQGAALYGAKKINKTVFKEYNFAFLRGLRSVDGEVAAFWASHQHKIYAWYWAQKQPSDVIISASPEFLLAPICRELDVTLIASEVDPQTGRFRSENCHDTEKVRRFRAVYPTAAVEAFYSDSVSDRPMAELAARAYLVRDRMPHAWKLHP